jgi:prepilin-type N-terminal cleavage/methylation domain-containing protein
MKLPDPMDNQAPFAGSPVSSARRHGFTLIEVLIATLSFAIILAALNTAFYASLRLRSRTMKLVEDVLPFNQVGTILRRDLRGIQTLGVTAGPLQGEATGLGLKQSGRLEFYTSSGLIDDLYPWGDMQKVAYYLKQPDYSRSSRTLDMVRAVTRNILASSEQDLEETPLVNNVETMQITFYNGSDWVNTWYATNQEPALPLAIKMSVYFTPTEIGKPARDPLEFLVPILTQAPTNPAASTITTVSGS